MNKPLVCQLSCQGQCWVAMFGADKRWKHISAKRAPRLGIVDLWEITTLIGLRCKRRKAFSRELLIDHSLQDQSAAGH